MNSSLRSALDDLSTRLPTGRPDIVVVCGRRADEAASALMERLELATRWSPSDGGPPPREFGPFTQMQYHDCRIATAVLVLPDAEASEAVPGAYVDALVGVGGHAQVRRPNLLLDAGDNAFSVFSIRRDGLTLEPSGPRAD